MSCKKWERKLYLYDELTVAEQKLVDGHLVQCLSCREKMMEIQENELTVKYAAGFQPQIRHAEELTHSIMNRIRNEKAGHKNSVILTFIDHLYTRYALAAASVLLLAVFISEQRNDWQRSTPIGFRNTTPVMQSTLKTKSFLKNIRPETVRREDNSLLSLYNCAKQKGCDKAFLKNFIR